MTKSRRARILAGIFGIAGGVFLVVTFVRSVRSTDVTVIPGVVPTVIAFLLSALGLWFAGFGWTCLFSDRQRRANLSGAFYASQLGKYVPGGVWQAVGLVSMSSSDGVGVARAGTVFPVHVVTQVAGTGFVGSLVAFLAPDAPPAVRYAALAGLAAPLLLYRGWMKTLLQWAYGWWGRDLRGHLPSQRAIITSFGWAALTIIASGAGFAVLLGSLSDADDPGLVIVAFSLAWVIGFLAIPFPSGLGVREAVLLAALSSVPAAVVAAAVIQRLATMVAEVLAIGVSRARIARHRRRAET